MNISNVKSNRLAPIIKWAGGKEKELGYIISNSPESFDSYYEPFVGGGSVYTCFDSKRYFINDKSEELINLYRYIADNSELFYKWINSIDSTWDNMLEYTSINKPFIDGYMQFRQDEITDREIKEKIKQHIETNFKTLNDILSIDFSCYKNIYFSEIEKNITRKIIRMKKIEKEKSLMPQEDIFSNIETAFMSSLYMYFRYLYNDKDINKKYPELATALFLFIRNYAYSGMFRYNESGDFNVPYGGMGYNHKTMKKKLEYYKSKALKEHLDKTTIDNLDFLDFFNKHNPQKNDFVFLDPPYDSEFSTYAKNSFTQEDQIRLANYLKENCNAKWMMVIKNTPLISSLYCDKGLTIKSFNKKYLVSFMNRNNKNAEHLIITNYL
jgi:DNA adenine methylase